MISTAPREVFRATTIAEKPIVGDALQSKGQGVQQEAAYELMGAYRHHFLLIVVCVVLPANLDTVIVH